MGQREGIDLKRLFHGNILTNLIYFLGFLTNLFIFLVFLDFLYFLPPSFFPREKLEALKENGFDSSSFASADGGTDAGAKLKLSVGALTSSSSLGVIVLPFLLDFLSSSSC